MPCVGASSVFTGRNGGDKACTNKAYMVCRNYCFPYFIFVIFWTLYVRSHMHVMTFEILLHDSSVGNLVSSLPPAFRSANDKKLNGETVKKASLSAMITK